MEKNSNPTQCQRLLDYMEKHEEVTQLDAMNELGIMRLASRISELRKDYYITRRMKKVENRFGEKCSVAAYRLEV